MKKRILSLLLALAVLISAMPIVTADDDAPPADDPVVNGFAELSAQELLAQMGAGWNLGNTLDAWERPENLQAWFPDRFPNFSADFWEVRWVGFRTSKALIAAVKDAGFNTIRIPVTWHKVADRNNDWKIQDDWMAKVKQFVDWAVELDMFIVLNTHHEEHVYTLKNSGIGDAVHFYSSIWAQVAEMFKDYGEKLIFEGLNEPRVTTEGGPVEWNYGFGAPAEYLRNVNVLNQAFTDTVRASGGNNAHRILAVPTYAGGPTITALNTFVVPTDPTNPDVNKFAMSIHSYAPFEWAHDGIGDYHGKYDIATDLDRVKARADALGVPVLLGEWGSIAMSHPPMMRSRHAEDYVTQARLRNMVTIWWDNGNPAVDSHGFGIINRAAPHNVIYPHVVEGIMRGLHGIVCCTDKTCKVCDPDPCEITCSRCYDIPNKPWFEYHEHTAGWRNKNLALAHDQPRGGAIMRIAPYGTLPHQLPAHRPDAAEVLYLPEGVDYGDIAAARLFFDVDPEYLEWKDDDKRGIDFVTQTQFNTWNQAHYSAGEAGAGSDLLAGDYLKDRVIVRKFATSNAFGIATDYLDIISTTWGSPIPVTLYINLLDKDGNIIPLSRDPLGKAVSCDCQNAFAPNSGRLGYVLGGESITTSDALEILKYIVRMEDNLIDACVFSKRSAAIVSPHNANITTADALEILKYIVKIPDNLISKQPNR